MPPPQIPGAFIRLQQHFQGFQSFFRCVLYHLSLAEGEGKVFNQAALIAQGQELTILPLTLFR